MRVALLTREYLPETRWGGIGTFYDDFARALLRAGHSVEVFTQGLDRDDSNEVDGIAVHRCMPRWYGIGPRKGGDLAGMPPRHVGVFAAALAREIAGRFARRHAERPFDVVESHEHLGIGALLPLTRGGRFRHLVRYHTAYHVLVDRGLEPWPRSRLIQHLERRAIRRAHLRIGPTEFIARITREHFRDIPDVDVVIPLSCRFEPAEPTVLKRKQPVIALIGRLVERKQPLIAAEVFRRISDRFPEWRLEIAGANAPHGGSTSAWDACCKILGAASSRCVYHGPLDASGIADLYTRASLTLIPSTFESFGLVALEAMNFGCVPIVSRGTALAEVVGAAGLTAPIGDVRGFATRVARLIAAEEWRRSMALLALRRCREHFDRQEILARNLKALFDPPAL